MAELRHYAELLDGRVRLKAWYDPERLPPGGELIDITGIKPEPETWALYDGKGFVSPAEAPIQTAASLEAKAADSLKNINLEELQKTDTGKALLLVLSLLLKDETLLK